MEWKKYKKKPVVVEAAQLEEVTYIQTLEGRMRGEIGDYLVKGVQGELYPVKPSIFAQTYELAEEAPAPVEYIIENLKRNVGPFR